MPLMAGQVAAGHPGPGAANERLSRLAVCLTAALGPSGARAPRLGSSCGSRPLRGLNWSYRETWGRVCPWGPVAKEDGPETFPHSGAGSAWHSRGWTSSCLLIVLETGEGWGYRVREGQSGLAAHPPPS